MPEEMTASQSDDTLASGTEESEAGAHLEESAEPKPKMVPLHELKSERAKRKELSARLQQLESQLTAMQSTGREDQAALSPEEQRRREWKRFLGQDRIEEEITALKQLRDELTQLKESTARASQGGELAVNSYFASLEQYARSQYDPKSIPVPAESWERLVAAEMTPAEMGRIVNGDTQAYLKVIDRCKKMFAPRAQATQQRQLETVRNLPKVPGPGGHPPSPPQEEPLTGRKLHARSADRFFEAMQRER